MIFNKPKKEANLEERLILSLIDDINGGNFDEDVVDLEPASSVYSKTYKYYFGKVGHIARGTCAICEISFEHVQYSVFHHMMDLSDVGYDIAKNLFDAMNMAILRNKKRKQDNQNQEIINWLNNKLK